MLVIQLLRKNNLVTDEQIEIVRTQRESGQSLLDALIHRHFISEQDVCETLSGYLGETCPRVDVMVEDVDLGIFSLLPVDFLRKNVVLPLNCLDDGRLRVAMRDPTNVLVLDDVQQSLSYDIVPVLALGEDILRKIICVSEAKADFSHALARVEEFSSKKIRLDDALLNSHSSILIADRSPVVELVNNIIIDAVVEQASDIHIEPLEDVIELRYRIDGRLREKSRIPKMIFRHLVSRVKIMAQLDITETRRPQDSRIQMKVQGKAINLRVSTIPTIFGEKIVLRVLDPQEMDIRIDRVGLDPDHLKVMRTMIHQPQGMILVCGPTGSGKTSTLYGALKEMRCPEKNILTVEDPVEYTLEGVNQIQVNEKIGFTFSSVLRTVLRQDPDSILVGEIRDQETAQIAFRASLTGHLVLSSLHTNSAVAAITRLIDIGIEPFLISSSLLCVVAQRLIRLNCEHCQRIYMPPKYLIERYREFFPEKRVFHFYRGEGCEACRYTGYKGRTGIFEFLPLSDQVRHMVCDGVSETRIRDYVMRQEGFRTITESGIDKVVQGRTTLEELESVLGKQFQYDGRESSSESKTDDLVSGNIRDFLALSFHGRSQTALPSSGQTQEIALPHEIDRYQNL